MILEGGTNKFFSRFSYLFRRSKYAISLLLEGFTKTCYKNRSYSVRSAYHLVQRKKANLLTGSLEETLSLEVAVEIESTT